jgi:uncharacterized protein
VRLELKDLKEGLLEQEYACCSSDFPVLADMSETADVQFRDPLHFKLRLQKTGQIVEVDGSLSATVGLRCGRCLQPFEQLLTADFALTFSPLVVREEVEAEEIELEADELGLIYYRDETLELREPLQEQLIMAVPIGPVCRDACQGLCPECGTDQNEAHCDCEKKPFNNKFGALADLKLDKS